ncbi:type II secretion system protein GspG [Gilvimarinus chinensis]|uniref:type II secretion system protein GspG n=1 Tax=Gilvimarinus chinensis TaxID=396005 RepID=UPI00036BFF69|nr:type II secretion system protein GspG [Gilvimarinus chinensis]
MILFTATYDSREYSHIKEETKVRLYDLGKALALYSRDYGRYPSSEQGSGELVGYEKRYVRYLIDSDAWGNRFIYLEPPKADMPFNLYSKGKNQTDERGGGDDISYWKVKPELDEAFRE